MMSSKVYKGLEAKFQNFENAENGMGVDEAGNLKQSISLQGY